MATQKIIVRKIGTTVVHKRRPVARKFHIILNEPIESIYYMRKDGLSGAVHHFGDNLTGAGEGDDEVTGAGLRLSTTTI